MTAVLDMPIRQREHRWPLDALMAAAGASDNVALARRVRIPLAVVVRAHARGLQLGQAESWCRMLRLDPTSVWAEFTASRADEPQRGRRYDVAPVLADLPADLTIFQSAAVLGVHITNLRRWLDGGIPEPSADLVAIRRGVHPSYFWPEWGAA